MKRYWVGWHSSGVGFEYNGPWWISGERFYPDGTAKPIFVAAVLADGEEQAKGIIEAAHDKLVKLEWRFAEEQPADWRPYSQRFPEANWMKWP